MNKLLQRKERFDYKNYEDNNKKETKKPGLIIFYIIFIIFIGIILAIHISQTVTITHLSYKAEELQSEVENIENENHQLQLETAKRLSLTNIEKIARNKLGMVEPDKTRYVILNKNKKLDSNEKIANSKSNMFQGLYSILEKWKTVRASSPE